MDVFISGFKKYTVCYKIILCETTVFVLLDISNCDSQRV